jgi:hypothetical protein
MSERHRPHNGRDLDGHFKVKKEDVEDVRTEPDGVDIIRDDVRLGGAVEDIGADAGRRAVEIGNLVEDNRQNVDRLVGREPGKKRRGR